MLFGLDIISVSPNTNILLPLIVVLRFAQQHTSSNVCKRLPGGNFITMVMMACIVIISIIIQHHSTMLRVCV